MTVIERLPRWRCTECGRVYPAWQMGCDDDCADLLRFDVDYVPVAHLQEATAEVERLRRLIGEAYEQRGGRPMQVLRELFGASREVRP